jgi:UDP-glucose 4-epimerase
MKAVVFGGAGFLGSHVADALTRNGHEVTIFDIAESKYLQANQTMLTGSILDEDAVNTAIKGADFVFNFAAIAEIDEANKNPVETVKHNILGNTIILEACRQNKIKRYVFASTVYVYSDAGAFYRSSKQACELIIENYKELYGLPYTILRYGSLYGPRSDERNYIYKILKQAVTENKITSFGKGEDLREYIHVEDAAQCSVEILSDEFENQNIILTGTQPMRRRDLLVMIKEMLGNKIELDFSSVEATTHYEITPYSFSPKIARKYVKTHHIDMGQGILQCIKEIYKKYHPHEEINGVIVKNEDDDE